MPCFWASYTIAKQSSRGVAAYLVTQRRRDSLKG